MLRAPLTLLATAVAAVVALVATAPAAWVASRVAAATGNALLIADPRGFAWHGSGMLASGDGRWRMPLAWRVDPARLPHGELAFELEPAAGLDTPRGTLAIDARRLRGEGLAAALPVDSLETFATGPVALAVGGDLVVDLPAFELAQNRVVGNGTIVWERARIAIANGPTLTFGKVAATLAPQGEGIGGTLANDGGEIRVTGTFELRPDEASVAATLAPAPGAPPEVARALAALGSPDATGAVRVAGRARRR